MKVLCGIAGWMLGFAMVLTIYWLGGGNFERGHALVFAFGFGCVIGAPVGMLATEAFDEIKNEIKKAEINRRLMQATEESE